MVVPRSNNHIKFSIADPGGIVVTDNGDPANLIPFPSHELEAFNGLAMVIVRSIPGKSGKIMVKAESLGLKEARIVIESK